MTIRNPVLPGFHPDPSIVRVGDDFYIATSTFEWFPGVAIHHSRDLRHWRLLTYALTDTRQLDMTGNIDSGGVWAPCLSHDGERFYLVYTDVKSRMGAFKDTHNYLVTAERIEGPWSDPVYLNSSGFDPSLFHDDDGRKWLVNMLWDHRANRNRFAGIVLQEYSPERRTLIGERKTIFRGTELGLTEGPHLYKRGGLYYLLTAEGGTQYGHAATMARAPRIDGPYEADPFGPILTSADRPELPLQKAGHASLVETQTGEWYMAHLVGRPLPGTRRCVLGRETAIQRCEWTPDGWLRLEGGGRSPRTEVRAPALPEHPFPPRPAFDPFDAPRLAPEWNTLRLPADPSWLSLTERPGWLRLRGRESLSSTHRQSLVARRQQAFNCEAETMVQFEPEHSQQMAGLILYYDTRDYIYLRISRDEKLGKHVGVVRSVNGRWEEFPEAEASVEGVSLIRLKACLRQDRASFFYAPGDGGGGWRQIGPELDLTHLSDEAADYIRFTGNFIGLCAQDLSGMRKEADFDYFAYREYDLAEESKR
jgi:xylan 1,4-beta-xylosidase